MAEPCFCKCGGKATVCGTYITGSRRGYGYSVRCQNNHTGPFAKTERGALMLWNNWQESELTLEQIDSFMGIGVSLEEAMQIIENRLWEDE